MVPDVVREALQFYAEPKNWQPIDTGIGEYDGDAVDYGSKARAALEVISHTPPLTEGELIQLVEEFDDWVREDVNAGTGWLTMVQRQELVRRLKEKLGI